MNIFNVIVQLFDDYDEDFYCDTKSGRRKALAHVVSMNDIQSRDSDKKKKLSKIILQNTDRDNNDRTINDLSKMLKDRAVDQHEL